MHVLIPQEGPAVGPFRNIGEIEMFLADSGFDLGYDVLDLWSPDSVLWAERNARGLPPLLRTPTGYLRAAIDAREDCDGC